MRCNTSIPCIRSDNNPDHMLRTVSQHIRPETLQRHLHKVSTVTLECDAWISLWFSSDIPFLNSDFLFSHGATFAASLGLPFSQQALYVRFESDDSIGRRSG